MAPSKEKTRKTIGTHISSSEKAVIIVGIKNIVDVIVPKIATNLGKCTFRNDGKTICFKLIIK